MPANLKELLIDELRDAYHAEKQLVKALPKLAKAATSPQLREAFENHLAETEEHVTRLEQAFEMLDETARAKTCPGMLGIVEEASELLKEKGKDKGAALDAGLIAGAQRAEHYEMAAYGTLRSWAEALGHQDVAELLAATLEEEKAADEKLSELAQAGINEAASSGEEEEEEDADESDEDESDEEEDEQSEGDTGRSGGRRASGNGKSGGNGNGGARRQPARMNMSGNGNGNGRAGQASRRPASRR
jgi:ferritin-like metal-binding protein YciE